MNPRISLLAILTASSLAAQVPPGSAVLSSASGFSLVDPAGIVTPVTGLNPATLAAVSLVIAPKGILFAGLPADNSTGSGTLPLSIRRIALRGAATAQDLPFATLLAVPRGESWAVTDLKVRANGELLAACTRLSTPSSPASAAFLVDRAGAATPLATTGYPSGALQGIADAGERYVGVFVHDMPMGSVELVSFPYSPLGAAPFQVFTRTRTYGSGGIGVDADGTIVFVLPPPFGGIARIQHAPQGTATAVAGVPRNFYFGELVPASGVVAGIDMTGTPWFVDTLAGGAIAWGSAQLASPLAVAVRHDPEIYFDPAHPVSAPVHVGSFGGNPVLGNAAFGLRVGGAAGASAFVLLGAGPASLPTSMGVLLVDPLGPIVTLGPSAVAATGEASIPLPLPVAAALAGQAAYAQAVLLVSRVPLVLQLGQALAITLL